MWKYKIIFNYIKYKCEQVILESDKELTINKKNYIEAICETMYDESNEWYEDIYDMPPYDIVELFEKQ